MHKKKNLVQTNDVFQIIVCSRIYSAPPTAELEPLVNGQLAQTDEVCNILLNFFLLFFLLNGVFLINCSEGSAVES